jgi:pimeloyl-ACP methyl ester carboxylesterase
MLKDFYQLSVPKCVIHCRQDRSLPQGTFHPRMSARLGAFRLLEIDGSHQVMFTGPAELSEAIIAAAREEV